MPRIILTPFLVILVALIACSGATPAPEVAETPASTKAAALASTETPTQGPTAAPAARTASTSTPVPTAIPTQSTAPTAEPEPERGEHVFIAAVDYELSDTEFTCIAESGDPAGLARALNAPGSATQKQQATLIGCLEDETLDKLFLAGFVGDTGPLSPETSVCIQAAFKVIDPREVMTAGAQGNPGAAMPGSMAGFSVTQACLTDQEWEDQASQMGMGPAERQGLQCLMRELGGPAEMAAAMTAANQGDVETFSAVGMACGLDMGTGPPPRPAPGTATPEPTKAASATPIPEPTPAATQTPGAQGDGENEVTAAVQQLFDIYARALRSKDAELLRSTMTRDLAESCRLDELQPWLEQDESSLAKVVVRSVFVDLADPSRAFAEVTPEEYNPRSEGSVSYPWPVALEDREWRAGFPYGLSFGRCPYEAPSPPSGSDGRERDFPAIPGLDLGRRDDILAAVPGTRVVHGGIRTDSFGTSFSSPGRMSGNSQQVNIYAELETDSATAELVRLYRDGLKHPSWDILDEGSSGDFGWFSWTVLDGDARLWHGKLVVAPAHEGWKHVWLSLYSDESDDGQ